MAATRRSSHRVDLLCSLRDLLRDAPEVRERPMFGYPSFFLEGRMFACLYGDGIGLKLPAARVAALLGGVGVRPFRPHGKPGMREWIHLVPEHDEPPARHHALVVEAMEFVRGRSGASSRRSRP